MSAVVIVAARQKEILTPEGVPIRVEIAALGERLLAFSLDLLLQILAVFVLSLLMIPLYGTLGGWGMAFVLLAFFLIRNFYFTFFEIRWRGETPGKRWRHLRVISRYGQSLTGEAVFARNLVREVEMYWPILFLLSGRSLVDATGLGQVAMFAWVMVFAFIPVLNRDHLRAGDLLGGTLVVAVPRALLLVDLSTRFRGSDGAETRYTFTTAQLSIYGIYELQVLEEVLRMHGRARLRAAAVVCDKIKTKIDWPREQWQVDDVAFLHDFYAAQRGHLEHGLLMGQRVESKRR